MATERRPWPEWAATGYFSLQAYIASADRKSNQALEIQHQNVYLLAKLLSQLFSLGHKIQAISEETLLRKNGDSKWPTWASKALGTSRKSGRYIKAGARHALLGLNIQVTLDGQKIHGEDNWKQVITGLTTIIDHVHKIQAALDSGPEPAPEFLSDSLAETLEMGETTITEDGGGRWRRTRRQ